MSRLSRASGSYDCDERGVTIVEAAFALPIFLFLLLGLVDLGYGVFQTSQATSAARDGARVAILDADDDSDIRKAVEARLAGQPLDAGYPVVTCLKSDGSNTDCEFDPVEDPNAVPHRVRVEVQWTYEPLTFVGATTGAKEIKGSATMRFEGSPIDPTAASDDDA